ncbi:esterase-like activity of phytase family protein [Allosphingosinicella deserti]|uniref:esterase-like activity of phytase family protein n=1 Tax=Allosphingosinicella deserti TaxID=2116704 RepID=UPI001304C026|nr:esterase-like activity of phytase family protein [Sphingomonas deserti]
MRILFCLVALLLLGTFAPIRITPPAPPPLVSLIDFQPVPVEAGRPGDVSVGKLVFLAGWNMESNDWRFGGISAMHVEGDRVIAVSDSGWLVRFPVPSGAGTRRASVQPVRTGSGAPVNKAQRDVESLIVNGRTAWVGLERQNGVWRFALPEWRELGGGRPAAMRQWEENNGPEAMVRLPDGRFIVFSEGDGGTTDVLMFPGDPSVPGARALRMRYRPPAGYRITDATLLPDGRLLLLNRRISFVSGMKAKLAIAPVPPPRAGFLIQPQEIAAFAPPLTVDNMEAVSVTRENGRTIVWLASDDNYMPLQRSLLLKFALEA